MIDQLRAAAEALNEGDPEPFAVLIAEECEWRGVSRRAPVVEADALLTRA